MPMKVSIIVPVYGVERYIRQCAESLFTQTYKDIEYIFCDDCSPDRSVDILRDVAALYPDRNVRIIHNDENLGLGGTRLHLLSEIHTDYFLIVDSDDILPPNAVESLVKRAKETGTDIVDGAYCEYHHNETDYPILPCHVKGSRYINKALCQNLIPLRVWGKLYKTSVINRVSDLFVKGIDFAEDICATSRLIAVTSRSWTDDVVYHYRTDNIGSYTNNITERNILSYFHACAIILSFYHKRGHLPFALEIGILNAYRECRRSSISTSKADEIIKYVPQHMRANLLYKMFCSKSFPLSLADAFYRILRFMAAR